MLPTKGYFQDIECPYLNSMCGRPYCHFRHRKKPNENLDESTNETEKNATPVVPTYKPTPKSELENIHNNKSHIPISYVPDLAFRPGRTIRQIPKFDKPTYKPTPLSILSSANSQGNTLSEENDENSDAIKEIKQNMANVAYNPILSLQDTTDIDFEDLTNEFSMIDEILYDSNMDTSESNGNELLADSNKETKVEKLLIEDTKKKSKSSEKHSKHSDKHRESSKSNKHSSKSESKSKHSKEKSSSSSSSSNHKKHSREKHRKEEKKDSSNKHSHKSSHRSKEKSDKKSSEKDRKRHRSKEKDKSKKEKTEKEPEKKKMEISENEESDDNINPPTDVEDLDDEDTMLECYKIFNEYKPEPKPAPDVKQEETIVKQESVPEPSIVGKKRVAHTNPNNLVTRLPHVSKSKTTSNPGQVMTNRFKLAKIAQANKEQDNLVKEVKQITSTQIKRPPPSLIEAARQHKIKRVLHEEKKVSLVDQILNGATSKPKKIAPVANVVSMQRAKAKIEEMTKKKAVNIMNKTVAQTQKGSRVAHVPEFSLSDIPDVLQANKSKLPVNVRTRFLTLIADECVKLYVSKDEAYTRALNEEFSCYEKCKVLATYRNSAMLAVNRLRKEIQERQRLGLGLLDNNEQSLKRSSPFHGKNFYDNVKQWMLNEDDLDIHGYPKESEIHGRAVIKNRKSIVNNLDENERKCSRCSKIYVVDDDGWPIYEEECIYHPLKKRTLRGEQIFLCCKTNSDTGCATSDTHVFDYSNTDLEGFQVTMAPNDENDPRNYAVYALDCEMCYTTKGLELTRVTIVDTDCKTVYESLVKPLNPIIDYNTRFSGITKEQMDKTSTSILQIQANILHLCNSKTILVGHSLESDLKALKIIHKSVIDTSVLFPHKMGLPHKRALKVLASEYLKKLYKMMLEDMIVQKML